MSEVYDFLKLQLLFSAFLSALLWTLYGRSVRRDFFRWWAWAWTSFCGFLLLAILSIRFDGGWGALKFGLVLLTTELAFLQVPLLMLGAWALRSGKIETRWGRWFAGAALLAGALTFALSASRANSPETSFFLRSVPRTVALAAAMLFCAAMFARYWWRRRSSAAAFSAVCCLLYGVNQVFYSLSLSERLILGASSARRVFDLRFITYHEFVLLDVCYTAGLCLAILLLRFEEQRRLEQALIASDRRVQSMAARNAELQAHIQERRRIHEALTESEAKFRSLAESAACAIWIWRDDSFLYLNPQTEAMLGYTRQELFAMRVWTLIHPDHRELVQERARRRLDGDQSVPSRYEMKILTQAGEVLWLDFTARLMLYQGEPAILATAFDITERKKAEDALRTLGRRLIHAQEEERSRVARELHDNINQRLALLGIAIQQARRALPELSDGQRGQIEKLWHMADEISKEVQALSHELHSAHLRHLGLAAAVANLAKEFQQNHDIAVECWTVDVPEDLNPEVALALFRVVQEALHNAGKYSHATRIHVGIEGLPHALHLEVSDDGVGFDPQKINGQGLGLTSMEERVRFIGAEFHLVSAPGAGTRVEVLVPLQAPRKPAAREDAARTGVHAGA